MNLLRFPLIYRTKKPAVSDWQNATPAQLAHWCEQAIRSEQPYNWGVRLDGLVVIDCDSEDAVARWEREAGDTVSVYQSRGNPDRRSYWYQLPTGNYRALRAGKMWNGEVDIKTGPGHQMVVSPSVHPDGHKYIWCGKGGDPGDWQVTALPVAPLDMLQAERWSGAADGPEEDGIPEGCRDVTMTAVAGALRRYARLSEDGLIRVLTAVDAVGCIEPLGNAAVNRIARSVAQYPVGPIECVLLDDDEEEE